MLYVSHPISSFVSAHLVLGGNQAANRELLYMNTNDIGKAQYLLSGIFIT